MNCPACEFPKNKVVNTERWDTFDTRYHRCLRCGYKFQTVAMPVSMEAMLLAVAAISRDKFQQDKKADNGA